MEWVGIDVSGKRLEVFVRPIQKLGLLKRLN